VLDLELGVRRLKKKTTKKFEINFHLGYVWDLFILLKLKIFC